MRTPGGLPRARGYLCPGTVHESLYFLQGKDAIFVDVHCLEDPLVSRLKLLQGNGSVTITVHHGEKYPHHHAGMHAPRTKHAHSVVRLMLLLLLLLLRSLWLRHRPLLGARSDSATHQNKGRRREHQNSLSHFKPPTKILEQCPDSLLSHHRPSRLRAPHPFLADAYQFSLGEHGIYQDSGIMNDDIFPNRDRAGFRIELDDGGMRGS